MHQNTKEPKEPRNQRNRGALKLKMRRPVKVAAFLIEGVFGIWCIFCFIICFAAF